jgi:hypothetical protein
MIFIIKKTANLTVEDTILDGYIDTVYSLDNANTMLVYSDESGVKGLDIEKAKGEYLNPQNGFIDLSAGFLHDYLI